MPKLKDEQIDGKTFEIHVDGGGKFYATMNGERTGESEDTMADLVKALRQWARKQKLSIQVSVMFQGNTFSGRNDRPATVRDATITGIHGRTSKPLIQWEDTKERQQLDGYGCTLMRRLTADEANDVIAMCQAVANASRVFDARVEELKVSAKELIDKAANEGGE